MSFDESMFSAGFNQNTTKEDMFVKGNLIILPRNWHGKTLEDSRRLSTKAEAKTLPGGADRLLLRAAQPLGVPPIILVAMSVLHHLLGCIYTVYSSWFDPRAQD
jgi:hypothetical protein